jgi:putative ATP-dependent endonuclease of the OLD family
MFLTKIDIKNFRGLVELSLSFDETTVLIGDNNTGKSTILAAIQICLSRVLNKKGGAFGEYDYHLKDKDEQPTDAAPIEITLTFSESKQGQCDLQLNFHPATVRASAVDAPCGAV